MTYEYFNWLIKKVKRKGDDKTYFNLLNILSDQTFVVHIPEDKNRALDGVDLRCQYYREHTDIPYQTCSWLEFLIALSRRMSYIMCSEYDKKHASYYFWKMLSNCGLDRYDDSFFEEEDEGIIRNTLSSISERLYDPDGNGGLFPLRTPKDDQRSVEIWYQMSNWLSENNDISLVN